MAITIPGLPNFQQPSLPVDRARAQQPLPEVPQNPEAGSLVIIDTFQDNYVGADHGNVAAYAARQHGFRGQIFAETIGPDTPSVRQSSQDHQWLRAEPRDAAQTRATVESLMRNSQAELLTDVTGDLDKVRQRGLQDSAVNVSYGTHPQLQADNIYRQVRSPLPTGGMFDSGQIQFSQNILNGYGIDPSKFYSNDPEVSGPERVRLQEQLLAAAQKGAESDQVVDARTDYERAVKELEANNNSVVVSAGNQEQLMDELAQDAGGRRATTPAGSKHNVLVNSQVTTVGATRWFNNGTERLAGYSTRDPELDIYASGSVGNGENQSQMHTLGTSFAAPRVAAAMATLHGNHPGMPSSAVENLMRNRLTHDLGDEKVLDFQLAEEYMRRGVF